MYTRKRVRRIPFVHATEKGKHNSLRFFTTDIRRAKASPLYVKNFPDFRAAIRSPGAANCSALPTRWIRTKTYSRKYITELTSRASLLRRTYYTQFVNWLGSSKAVRDAARIFHFRFTFQHRESAFAFKRPYAKYYMQGLFFSQKMDRNEEWSLYPPPPRFLSIKIFESCCMITNTEKEQVSWTFISTPTRILHFRI